ncbi:hypothetical protein BDF19DRAFT_466649 [Syncephalis fuscata]|nr:hypothetical protein BDF19DRAFT_466649 [Syncephalis fuscata]
MNKHLLRRCLRPPAAALPHYLPAYRVVIAKRLLASGRHSNNNNINKNDNINDDDDYDSPARYERVFPMRAADLEGRTHTPLRLADVLPELASKEAGPTTSGESAHSTADTDKEEEEARKKNSARKALFDLPWLIVKITVAFGAATVAAGGVGWMGLHAFAEYYATPDKRLPSEVRSLLRGAYVRDTLLPEPAAVAKYLEKALVMMEMSSAEIPRSVIIATHYWLAYTFERLGRLAEAADMYRHVLKAWSTTERKQPASMIEVSRMVAVSRRLGETLTRLGQFDEAGRVLWAAVYIAKPLDTDYLNIKSMMPEKHYDDNSNNHQQQQEQHSRTDSTYYHSPEAVRCVVSLANVLALQRNFDDALTLYAGALHAAQSGIQQEQATGQKAKVYWSHTAVPASNTWTCLDAQVMGHLAEIYAVQNDIARAGEWSRKGLELSKAVTGEPACDSCTGMILANLALLKEATGHDKEAQQLFSRAHSYAKKANDIQAMLEYGHKARQLRVALQEAS